MAAESITIRANPKLIKAITELATSMERSRNWVIENALKNYLEVQSWQVEGVKQALAEVDRGEKLASHKEVFAKLRKKLPK